MVLGLKNPTNFHGQCITITEHGRLYYQTSSSSPSNLVWFSPFTKGNYWQHFTNTT